jgi:hypothetical protein
MKVRLQRLRAEIGSDRAAFEARLAELHRLELASETAAEADLAQAALALHHAYGAVESLLERVSRTIEGSLPEGADWHQALLDSMALEIEDVRPRVLGDQSVGLLRRLLAFRHFLRHAYAVKLDRDRLVGLRDDALALQPHLTADIDQLDSFLSQLAERLTG